jgi:cellulose synthase operon protein C
MPAELAALEHAFATDPASKAYRPLTEAYLAAGRFMEAMVVCKKGVKAHPGDVAARLLLARVYSEQGKDRKALEEVQTALQEHASDPAVNRAAGVLQMKLGDKEAGAAALRRAAEEDPTDPETAEALKQWGLPPPAPPAPATTPRPRPVAEAIPVAPRVARPVGGAPASAPPVVPAAPATTPRPAPASGRAPPPGKPEKNLAYSEELAEKYGTEEHRLPTGKTGEIPLPRAKKGAGLRKTFLLVALLGVVLAGWYTWSAMRKARAIEIDRLLKQTRELIEKDSHGGYKQAARLCEQILERDADSLGGHAFLAYVDALRWGEHGEGEGYREEAKKHLEAARRERASHSHLFAADAFLKFYGGDPKGATAELERVLKGPEAGTSGLLYGALGVIQMQSGDLDAARDSLSTARKFADRDVRVNQMLAEQYRRRGAGYELQASTFYDAALRLSPEHVPSLIGSSLLLVGRDQYDEGLKRIQKVLDQKDASPRQLALAHVVKGNILFAKGKPPQEGAAEEQQALMLDPSNPDIHNLVGRRKLRDGDVPGAIEEAQRAVQMDPQRVAFYVDLAAALMRKKEGGTKQAVEALRKATERLSGNARIVKLLGDAYRADGDLERARGEYEKAIGLEKRYPDARMALARVWRDKKDFVRAQDELDRAIKDYGEGTVGGASQAYVEKAEIEEARGGSVDAIRDLYERALRSDATNCRALWWLGRDRAEQQSPKHDADLAGEMFSDYARLCPREPHAAEAARLAAAARPRPAVRPPVRQPARPGRRR